MSKFYGIVNLFAIILIGALVIGFTSYNDREKMELEQLRLSYAIDYCTDAAIDEMLRTGSLDMDYANKDYMNLNPKLGMDSFVDMFLLNYGMSLSDENRTHVKLKYIPTMCVATFDGYYLATQQIVKSKIEYPTNKTGIDPDFDLVFSPKLPYSYKYKDKSYALNFGMNFSYELYKGTLTKKYSMPPKDGGTLTNTEALKIINNNISSAMSYAIDKTNEANVDWNNSFYIPSVITTYSGVNPITGPSIIVLMQNVDINTVKPIGAFSVGGSRVSTAKMVVGYERDGKRYYCYAEKAPSNIKALDMFTSVYDAARAGYLHDTEYMQ